MHYILDDSKFQEILKDSCFRVSYTFEPTKLVDISKITKANDVYNKEDK